MEWTSIVVAAFACLGTAAGSIYGIQQSTSLVEYRLKKLEDEVNKHNQVIERTNALQTCVQIHEERIKVANHRIDDLEGKV